MEGAKKGSFWSSTAAMMTAVGTLLAALAAVGTFLAGQRFIDDWQAADNAGNDVLATDSEGKKLDGQLLSSPTRMLLANIDFDVPNVPNREPDISTTDLFYSSLRNEISAPHGMAKWEGEHEPSQSQCTTLVATDGVSADHSFQPNDFFCLKTNEARIARFKVIEKVSTGWRIETTVWKQRLAAG